MDLNAVWGSGSVGTKNMHCVKGSNRPQEMDNFGGGYGAPNSSL